MINIIEVVKKLIGRIDPDADTAVDHHRMNNLITWEEVVHEMVMYGSMWIEDLRSDL